MNHPNYKKFSCNFTKIRTLLQGVCRYVNTCSKLKGKTEAGMCFIKKRSSKFRKIHRKAPVLEPLFNKVVKGMQLY